jgi:DNA (cytosine-5)-methyltransferase 1
MIYGSICSGIEAATVAWHPLGWRAAFFSEIAPFPRALLAHHYAGVPLHGDFTSIRHEEYAAIDVLAGGTPCQSFSVAGFRQGFADRRGSLTLEFVRLAERLKPRWLVWENVPGVLSIDGGRAFGAFLGGLAQCGYGFAYRVLDAQYFGVPQRRRRVFVVGYSGDWRPAAAVLFERDSLRRDIAPRGEAGEGTAGGATPCLTGHGDARRGFRDRHGLIAPAIPARTKGGGGLGTDFDCDGGLIASTGGISHCLNGGGMARQDYETETLVAFNVTFCDANGRRQDRPDGGLYVNETGQAKAVTAGGDLSTYVAHTLTHSYDSSDDGTGRGLPIVPITLAIRGREDDSRLEIRQDGVANAILTPNGGRSGMGVGAIAYNIIGCGQQGSNHAYQADISGCLQHKGLVATGNEAGTLIRQALAVRRLTPIECERLQGFPDNYTLIPFRGRPAADGHRYKALGNSMAVPVMRWIGERIAFIESLSHGQQTRSGSGCPA